MHLFTFQLLRKISPQLTIRSLAQRFITAFYWRLSPDQICSPEVSDTPVAVALASPTDTEINCINQKGDDGAYGACNM
jgi:hypothetical protein